MCFYIVPSTKRRRSIYLYNNNNNNNTTFYISVQVLQNREYKVLMLRQCTGSALDSGLKGLGFKSQRSTIYKCGLDAEIVEQLWWFLGFVFEGRILYIRGACNYPTRSVNFKSWIFDIQL